MASGIPTTRRTTRGTRLAGPAVLDENSHLRSTTASSAAAAGKAAPAAKDLASAALSTRAAAAGRAAVKAKDVAMASTSAGTGKQQPLATRKRAAFGEVSNRNGSGATAAVGAAGGKKAAGEKKPAATTASGASSTVAAPKRKTRTSLAAEQAAADLEAARADTGKADDHMSVDDGAATGVSRPTVASRHRAAATAAAAGRPGKTSTTTIVASSRSTAAAPAASAPAVSSRRTVGASSRGGAGASAPTTSTTVKREAHLSHPPPIDDDGAPAPAAKRARTSSPEKPAAHETVADVPSAPAPPPPPAAAVVEQVKPLSAFTFDAIDAAFEDDMEVPGEEEARTRAKDEGWEDLDEEDEFDPMMVSEYVRDIFIYMQKLEITTAPNPDYMDIQPELQWKMRSILIDWLIEVHGKFRLLPETLFLAVNLVDRFLSARVISLVKLQLVGTTALFVAAKYEEVICPSVTNFLYMADNGFQDDEILGAERYLLQTLDFNLSYPNPIHFLRRISKADNYDIQTRTVAKYYMEIACVDHKMLHLKPSEIAAGAAWLARHVLDRGEWNANLVHYSGYSEDELLPAAQLMLNYILRSKEKQAESFVKKYASKKYMKASTYSRDWAVQRYRDDGIMADAPKGAELRHDVLAMRAQRALLEESDDDY